MKYAAVFATVVATVAAAPNGTPLRQRTSNVRFGDRSSALQLDTSETADDATTKYSSNWSGAVNSGTGFTYVTGTIAVPSASGGDGTGASAWVGIDGESCKGALIQTGINLFGDGTYGAWYEWIPDHATSFSNFPISVGDQIQMSINVTSSTSGVATLENLSSGGSVTHNFKNPPSTLCQNSAEWIVEDFKRGGSPIPFANYGTVTFTDNTAHSDDGTITPGSDSTTINLRQNGNVMSECGISGSDVTCKFVSDGSS